MHHEHKTAKVWLTWLGPEVGKTKQACYFLPTQMGHDPVKWTETFTLPRELPNLGLQKITLMLEETHSLALGKGKAITEFIIQLRFFCLKSS